MQPAQPWLPTASPLYANAFRAAIKALVRDHARRIALPDWEQGPIYLVDLVLPGGAVKLHIYEERAQDATVCDQCRCMGASRGPSGLLGARDVARSAGGGRRRRRAARGGGAAARAPPRRAAPPPQLARPAGAPATAPPRCRRPPPARARLAAPPRVAQPLALCHPQCRDARRPHDARGRGRGG
jgi:hypothetical protein